MKSNGSIIHSNHAENALLSNKFYLWLLKQVTWENAVLLLYIVLIPFLAFHNLDINPRTWHDEGSSLSVSRTLVEDGRYAMRSSDGYQTFGPIQSVGPTVLLPVAWMFKFFGISLLNGRIVAAMYILMTVILFYFAGKELFGKPAALFSVFLLISSPAARFFLYGRQVLGEVPALGFFLAGWLLWARATKTRKWGLAALSGLLFGTAIVTKSQYLLIATASLGIITVADFFFYRAGTYRFTVLAGILMAGVVAAWYGWQWVYFGQATFLENVDKLRQLAAVTTGFRPDIALHGLRSLFGSDTGNYYQFWGVFALLFFVPVLFKKDAESQNTTFLFVFTFLWLCFYVLWTIPWQRYALPAMTVSLFFISKLYTDLAKALLGARGELKAEIIQWVKARGILSSKALLSLGTGVALFSFTLWMGYQGERIVRSDILDTVGDEAVDIYTPRQLYAPAQVAEYLNQAVDPQSVVETWERELTVFTAHNYHFPDQVNLVGVDKSLYLGGSDDYRLGESYFRQAQPAYVVVGFYARFNQIYDMKFIHEYYDLVKTVGSNGWQYEVYKLNRPLPK